MAEHPRNSHGGKLFCGPLARNSAAEDTIIVVVATVIIVVIVVIIRIVNTPNIVVIVTIVVIVVPLVVEISVSTDRSGVAGSPLFKAHLFRLECQTLINTLIWVAVKELKLSSYIGETLLFTIYTHYGDLI